MRKKIVIITSDYPSEDNKYGATFIHSRLLHYLPSLDVQVLGYNQSLKDAHRYTYEGVNVELACSKVELVERLRFYNPDYIGFHFIEGWMVDQIVKKANIPIFIWIHGFEALGWHRRLFNLELNIKSILSFSKYVVENIFQMRKMRDLINYANNREKRITFIFVSNWMKRITEDDTASQIKNFKIIPNPIDVKRFSYIQKEAFKRKKVLLIRPFHSKKYANDIAVEAILKLSRKKELFNMLEFEIYGKGKLFEPLTKGIRQFSNVKIYNKFIINKDIPKVHKEFGIFLCPTRQDAQGVSMCEAMASGLVPISSDNTAIPEFIEDNKTGFLTMSAEEIAEKIEYLYNNPSVFQKMSEEASKSISEISSTASVINAELKLIASS